MRLLSTLATRRSRVEVRLRVGLLGDNELNGFQIEQPGSNEIESFC